jgi:4-hydroxythreonine-4-phosphate dehydrogenase
VKPILVTSGEPAGIGPDLCFDLVASDVPTVVLGDINMLAIRASKLGREIAFVNYTPGMRVSCSPNHLTVLHIPCSSTVVPGVLDLDNVPYVLTMLEMATDLCLQNQFSAMVTAPVHKGIINDAGILFTGHTEFISARCDVETVVMMLVCDVMRVALVTTHLPLKNVSAAVTQALIIAVIECLDRTLQQDFSIKNPRLYVAGLNPHAGEGGHLGMEELEVITPALNYLSAQHIDVHGPFAADTLFTPKNLRSCDAFVAMYHDQGLAVLKYAGFGNAVNITLGLPIIRTSVDHGTALELAGTGLAQSTSLRAAVAVAAQMVQSRASHHDD